MATFKQKLAFGKSIENYGNISKSMIQAGYSKASAVNPKILTESKGWKELAEEYWGDELLIKVGLEGLYATKIHSSHTEPDKEVPDFQTRHKYLETALKTRGKLKETELGPDIGVNIGSLWLIKKSTSKD